MFRWLWRYGAPVFAVWMLFFAAVDIGPAWDAHFGDHGTKGSVIVTSEECSHVRFAGKTCDHYGNFRGDEGSEERRKVLLATGFGRVEVGDRLTAYDTGDGAVIYPPGGGDDWSIIVFMMVGSTGLLIAWSVVVARPALRRFRSRRA